jgi:DNA polymerase-3 subunit epsilon
VTGATTVALMPAGPSDLVVQLNAAAKSVLLWPWCLALTVVLAFVLPWILLLGVPLTLWMWWQDKIHRTVVAFYEVDGPAHGRYQGLVDAFQRLQQVHGAWHVVASGDVRTTYQHKVNAGASALIQRKSLARLVQGPPNLSANIAIPSLNSGYRSVYFLPDRALVKDGNTYADLPYQSLAVDFHEQRFIESDAVPQDAVLVGHTWKYVNKGGGPDRRFKDNRQLPIMQYGRLTLRSAGGLNVIWDFSQVAASWEFARAVTGLTVR